MTGRSKESRRCRFSFIVPLGSFLIASKVMSVQTVERLFAFLVGRENIQWELSILKMWMLPWWKKTINNLRKIYNPYYEVKF